VLLSSDLVRVELCRALMRLPRLTAERLAKALDDAAGDLALEPLTSGVVALAMRLRPQALRSLGALHLSTAVLLDVDVLVTYDHRLSDAATANGIRVAAPGPE
jgi:predicted nucleic acid-binding protein